MLHHTCQDTGEQHPDESKPLAIEDKSLVLLLHLVAREEIDLVLILPLIDYCIKYDSLGQVSVHLCRAGRPLQSRHSGRRYLIA